MNSDMSSRISESWLPNMNSASIRGRYVLPTPVGPMNMKTPIGRFGSLRPARERRTALEMAVIASSWPMTLLCSASSMCRRRSCSSLAMRVTGMPVHMLTTSAMSSGPTTGASLSPSAPSSSSRCSSFSCSFTSRSRSSAANSYCWELMALSFSLRRLSNPRSASLSDGGVEERLMRTREDASSIRSIALSGRKRSPM